MRIICVLLFQCLAIALQAQKIEWQLEADSVGVAVVTALQVDQQQDAKPDWHIDSITQATIVRQQEWRKNGNAWRKELSILLWQPGRQQLIIWSAGKQIGTLSLLVGLPQLGVTDSLKPIKPLLQLSEETQQLPGRLWWLVMLVLIAVGLVWLFRKKRKYPSLPSFSHLTPIDEAVERLKFLQQHQHEYASDRLADGLQQTWVTYGNRTNPKQPKGITGTALLQRWPGDSVLARRVQLMDSARFGQQQWSEEECRQQFDFWLQFYRKEGGQHVV